MEPLTAALSGISRIIAKLVADFPDPDSPTSPSVSPHPTSNEIPRTASLAPNAIRRPCTDNSGTASNASPCPAKLTPRA